MRKLLKDDSGIAYGLFIVASFLLLGGALYIIFIPAINKFANVFNIFISQGMVSQDTSDAFGFNLLVVASMTIFMVLGVAAWGITRALEKKNTEG